MSAMSAVSTKNFMCSGSGEAICDSPAALAMWVRGG